MNKQQRKVSEYALIVAVPGMLLFAKDKTGKPIVQRGRFRNRLKRIYALALPMADRAARGLPECERAEAKERVERFGQITGWQGKPKHIITIVSFCAEQKSQYERAKVFSGGSSNELVAGSNVGSNTNKVRRGRIQQQPGILQKENKTCADASSGFGIQWREKPIWKVWEIEPRVDRVADGIPNRLDRTRGLGNAIVPQAVMPIMLAIKKIMGAVS